MSMQACPTDRMRRVLVATDGSESCHSAVQEAIKLARICSSKLLAVSVVVTNREYEDVLPWVVDHAEQEMKLHLDAVKTLASQEGVDCEVSVLRGEDPCTEIVDEATRTQADMIIMGTHARTGIKRLLMGRLTAKVIGHSPCNILVAPPGSGIDYDRILLATDGSRHSEAACSQAFTIAKQCNSSLIIVSVVAPGASSSELMTAENNVSRFVAMADAEGVKNEGLVIRGTPHEGIAKTAAEKGAGLIVVGSHGMTGLMTLFMGSVTGQVISHTHSAVLVVKLGRDELSRH